MPENEQGTPEEANPNRDYTYYLNRHLDEEAEKGKEVDREVYNGHWNPEQTDGVQMPAEPTRLEGYIPDEFYGGSYTGLGSGPNSRSDNSGPDAGSDPRGTERSVGLGSEREPGRATGQLSDDQIRDEITKRLASFQSINDRDVHVTVKNGEVSLEGTVDDEPMRRLAQAVSESVRDVKAVSNMLTVKNA